MLHRSTEQTFQLNHLFLPTYSEEYSHRGMHEGTLILRAPGEIVAARYNQDQEWYRARVLQSTEEKVKVNC